MVLTTNIHGHCASKKKSLVPIKLSTILICRFNEHLWQQMKKNQRNKASINLKMVQFVKVKKVERGQKNTPHLFRVSAVWVINIFPFTREWSLLPSINLLSCYDLDGYRRLTSADSGLRCYLAQVLARGLQNIA